MTGITIDGNISHDSAKGGAGGYGGYGSGQGDGIILLDNYGNSAGITGAVVRNNLLYSNNRNGISFFDQAASTNYIVHNTLYANSSYGVDLTGTPAVNIVNNIICSNSTGQIGGSTTGTTAGNVTTCPTFASTNPADSDFLDMTSDLNNASTSYDDELAPTDYAGNSRPQDTGPEAGAYEYGAEASSTPSISGGVFSGVQFGGE
jgi:hypothetical protein